MQFPHTLFKQAGLNPTDVAKLIGVSNVTGWRWLRGVGRNGEVGQGVGVNIFLRKHVAQAATQVKSAVDAGALPDPSIQGLAPDARAAEIKRILKQYRTK